MRLIYCLFRAIHALKLLIVNRCRLMYSHQSHQRFDGGARPMMRVLTVVFEALQAHSTWLI